MLLSDQNRTIEQLRFTYSALGNALEKRTKIIEDQPRKQVEALKF